MENKIKQKSLPVRIDPELHKFFKVYASSHGTDMTSILITFIKKLKKDYEKVLTYKDVNV